jgi:hypothetical protein
MAIWIARWKNCRTAGNQQEGIITQQRRQVEEQTTQLEKAGNCYLENHFPVLVNKGFRQLPVLGLFALHAQSPLYFRQAYPQYVQEQTTSHWPNFVFLLLIA